MPVWCVHGESVFVGERLIDRFLEILCFVACSKARCVVVENHEGFCVKMVEKRSVRFGFVGLWD